LTRRVLHIVEPAWRDEHLGLGRFGGSDAAAIACAAAVRGLGHLEHHAIIIGDSLSIDRCRRLGLTTENRISAPMRFPRLAARAMRRVVRSRVGFDATIAWGEPLRCIVEQLGPEAGERVVIDLELTDNSPVPSLGALVPTAGHAAEHKRSVRGQLGIAPDAIVIGFLADPPARGDAARMQFFNSLMVVAGIDIHVLVSDQSAGIERALSPTRTSYTGREPIVTTLPMAARAAACDLCVHGLGSRIDTGGGRGQNATFGDRVLVQEVLARGVPVVSSAPNVLPVELEKTLLAPTPHPSAMAKIIAPLIEHPERLAATRSEVQGGRAVLHADTLAFLEHLAARCGVTTLPEDGNRESTLTATQETNAHA
jgi:hypothetical protein